MICRTRNVLMTIRAFSVLIVRDCLVLHRSRDYWDIHVTRSTADLGVASNACRFFVYLSVSVCVRVGASTENSPTLAAPFWGWQNSAIIMRVVCKLSFYLVPARRVSKLCRSLMYIGHASGVFRVRKGGQKLQKSLSPQTCRP